jgi:geranylgeranyl diphosphate synthase type II
MADMERYMQERSRIIDGALERILADSHFPADLGEVMRYAVFPAGKRFRPVLVIAAAESLGASAERVIPLACAVELIHSFSLVHDDLPCLDNDDERRGRPSCHMAFGTAQAMLAGNALIFLGLAHALREVPPGVGSEEVREAVALLCEASGPRGMIGGQYLELCNPRGRVSEEFLRRVHEMKTGALIRVATVAAAVLCGAGEEERQSLEKYGANLGFAFQITDDILDYRNGAEQVSFATLLGVDEARRLAHSAVVAAVDAVELMGERADNLRDMAVFLESRTF